MRDIRTIELDDQFQLVDQRDIQYLTKHSGITLKGVVEVTNEFGEVMWKKHNLIVAPGRLFVLEKLFNINSPVKPTSLASQLHITDKTTDRENGPHKDEHVCMFMIGQGGSELEFGSVNPPNYKDTNLFNPIPFRFVKKENDLQGEDVNKYFMRMETSTGYYAYFGKKFEVTPEIKVKRIGTDTDVNFSDIDEDFDIYVDINLKIDTTDLREYFNAGEGLEMARFNEIGLVIGQPDLLQTYEGEFRDYSNLQLFSKLTFNNEALDSNTKELNINYRIYA